MYVTDTLDSIFDFIDIFIYLSVKYTPQIIYSAPKIICLTQKQRVYA